LTQRLPSAAVNWNVTEGRTRQPSKAAVAANAEIHRLEPIGSSIANNGKGAQLIVTVRGRGPGMPRIGRPRYRQAADSGKVAVAPALGSGDADGILFRGRRQRQTRSPEAHQRLRKSSRAIRRLRTLLPDAARGIALVPEALRSLAMPNVIYSEIANYDQKIGLALAYRSARNSPAVQAFVEVCRGHTNA
jgi:hypothetical protein